MAKPDITLERSQGIVSQMAAQIYAAYIARGALDKPANINKVRQYIRQAFQNQIEERRFSLVEILSPCPTYWHLSPADSLKKITDEVIPNFPIGVIKDER